MKKGIGILIAIIMASVVLFAGCVSDTAADSQTDDQDTTQQEETQDDGDMLRVAIYLAGFQGDKAVIDSACNGANLLAEAYPGKVETKIVEGTFDTTKWDPGLRELAEAEPNYDIIFAGPFDLIEDLQTVANDYQDQAFVAFDANVDYTADEFANVYSMLFLQNQSSYLAGAAAAMAAENVDSDTIGVVAGMDITPLNDFVIPYILGAQSVNPDIKVLTSYVGNFEDSAKGKELALAQYNQGAAVVFGPAGQAGLGVFEASVKKGLYSVGCDGDQAMHFANDGDTDKADLMVTSAMKNVDKAILLAVEKYLADEGQWNEEAYLGITEDCVGIAQNEYYEAILTDEQKAQIDEMIEGVITGEIVVVSAFELTIDEITEIRDNAQK